MKITYISKETVAKSLWSGGETFQYFIYPTSSSYEEKNFMFRISSATINLNESVFTKFPNYTRYLVMIDNNLDILINGKNSSLNKLEVLKFNSNDDCISYSTGIDFNLMTNQNGNVIVSNTLTTKSDFTILFAINNCSVNINNNNAEIKKFDAIIIESSNEITITSNEALIISTVSIQK